MERQQKEQSNLVIKIITVLVLSWISSGDVYSQSMQLSKKLYAFSNNFIYQINLIKDDELIDSIKITEPVYFTMWDSIQFSEPDKNMFMVCHQLQESNTLTFDTLIIVERYLVVNGNKLLKQSGFKLKKLNNLRQYEFILFDNYLTVRNKNGVVVKTYLLSDYQNLEDLEKALINFL